MIVVQLFFKPTILYVFMHVGPTYPMVYFLFFLKKKLLELYNNHFSLQMAIGNNSQISCLIIRFIGVLTNLI
jgi:hypothetical protein